MSEQKRKYEGLKQAHKELSVEVVNLRSRLALADGVVSDISDEVELLEQSAQFLNNKGVKENIKDIRRLLTAYDKGVGDTQPCGEEEDDKS